jgi:DNA sulfur modification protein DndD
MRNRIHYLRADRVVAHREYEVMTSKSAEIAAELENLEKELQRQGGSYAKNRGRLEERRKQISARVDSLESSLREHATGLLPIAFAPNLLKDVLQQLDLEQDIRFAVVVDESLSRAARLTLSNLRKIEVGSGGRTSRLGDRPEFIEIERIVKRTHQPSDIDAPMIHDLSGEQDRQIQSWATICLNTLPSELTALGKQLEDLYRERQKVERDLERIPHDEVLKPLLDKVQACRVEFAEKSASVGGKRTTLEQLDQSIQTAEIAYKRAADVVASASSQRTSLDRAERAQLALRDFKDALVRQKIRAVEDELTICFNMLSRKQLKRIFSIDPVSFTVLLQDEQERLIPKSELSAGEKQIYAIAVLWALGRVAHRPAPIVIDTPLARLDSEHRDLIIKRYFPTVSHQVIILSTDTEIDRQSMSALEPSIARSYELQFNSLDQATVVSRGYFEEATQHEFS